MPRPPRKTLVGVVYHILNRRVLRLKLFDDEGDYAAFERVLAESLQRKDAPDLLAYCLMPNHWHLVVRAKAHSNLSTWMQWVTVTHTHRWNMHHHTVGQGPLYQGRFKSFPVQDDLHFLMVCRYVEANAVRANLANRAEEWRWSSLWSRSQKSTEDRPVLSDWPVDRPRHWFAEVNRSLEEAELSQLRRSVARGTPLGEVIWTERMVARAGLEGTMRDRGRPKKGVGGS